MFDLIDEIFVYDGLHAAIVLGSFLIVHSSKYIFATNER